MAVPKPPIVNLINQVPAGNFGVGRRSPISQLSEHHVVGDAIHAINKAKVKGNQFSTTYTIALDGTIYQLVEHGNTPYCDNDYRSNGRSITIEHAGGLLPNYPYTEAMYQSSIKLHAWLFQELGNLNPIRHRDIPEIKADPSKATACSGGLDVDRIVREARNLLKGEVEMKIRNNITYDQLNRLHRQIVGNWNMTKEYWDSIQDRDLSAILREWSTHPNSSLLLEDQVTGEKARKENWPGQITGLKTQLKIAQDEAAKLAKNPTEAQYETVKGQLEQCQTDAQVLIDKMNDKSETVPPLTEPKTSFWASLFSIFTRKK